MPTKKPRMIVTLPPDMDEELNQMLKEPRFMGMSKSGLMRMLIKLGLYDWVKEKIDRIKE